MKFKRIISSFFFLLLSFPFLYGQQHDDRLGPLKANRALVNYTRQMKQSHVGHQHLLSDSIMAKLPFLDDFSHGGPYPNDSLWMDQAAYINNTYGVWPPTIGVATLDGVNNEGQPYDPSCPPGGSEPADSLTSRPIDLTYDYTSRQHNLKGGDSVYLSFYWQAGGRGLAPQTSDTLLLQIRTSSVPWTTVWYHLGYSPNPYTDSGFHVAMIPLLDTMHASLDSGVKIEAFDPHFQFRFKNYACTSADADQWNIDEVRLDEHRTYKDTFMNDIAFVYQSNGILANYRYMPWEQFTANDIADTFYTMQRNNIPTSPKQISDTLKIPAGNFLYGATDNVNQDTLGAGASTSPGLTRIPLKARYTYTPLAGPTDIELTQFFTFRGDAIPSNDTLRFKQIFSNYYAYDDSTAETSYFINAVAPPVYLAEQITLNKPDTLWGLELYFDYMFVDPANYNMILAVWDNTGPNGSPGNLIYENNDTNVTAPRVSDTLNGFTYYPYISSHPLVFSAGQTIYVGWVQTNGDSLNIGFDRNTNSENKIFYWDNTYPDGDWQIASFQGSLMMRPVFGSAPAKHSPALGTAEVNQPSQTVALYPNPASDRVMLTAYMPLNTILKVFTADGRAYMSNDNFSGNLINTSSFPNGFYILEITPPGSPTSYQKLMIAR